MTCLRSMNSPCDSGSERRQAKHGRSSSASDRRPDAATPTRPRRVGAAGRIIITCRPSEPYGTSAVPPNAVPSLVTRSSSTDGRSTTISPAVARGIGVSSDETAVLFPRTATSVNRMRFTMGILAAPPTWKSRNWQTAEASMNLRVPLDWKNGLRDARRTVIVRDLFSCRVAKLIDCSCYIRQIACLERRNRHMSK